MFVHVAGDILCVSALSTFTHAYDICQRFLDRNPETRLGSASFEDICNPPWFASIDWEKLFNKQVVPPFKPVVKGAEDVENVDSEFLQELPTVTPTFEGKALTDPICGMPAWLLLLIVIPALFIFFYLTTPWTQPPTGWVFFLILFVAFFMSIMWVEEIADELVSLMNALGCIAGIQPFVMGLTILAVGNSISDLIGDVTITKQGYPQMAIGGIYASPMFSLLVGLGIALSIKYVEDP